MKRLLALTAAGEAALGLILLVHPPVVVRLLFGAEIPGAGMVMSRITGIGLIALGIACWPGRDTRGSALPLFGMFAYSALTTLYLAYQGLGGEWVGRLLWPAAALHAALTALLVRAWIKDQRMNDQR